MGNTESSTTCCTTPLDPLLGRRSGARSSPGSDKTTTRNALIVDPSQEGDDGTTHSELTSETFWLQHPSPHFQEGSNSTYDDDNDDVLCNKKNDATTTTSCAETTATTTTTRDPSSSSFEESSSVTLQQLEQECANYKKRVRQLEQLRQEDQELFRTLNDKLKHLLQVQEAYIKLQKDTQQQVQSLSEKEEFSSSFLEQKLARKSDEKKQKRKSKHKRSSVKKKSSQGHTDKPKQLQQHLDTKLDSPATNIAHGTADAAVSYSEHAQMIDHALAWLEANFVADNDLA